MDYNDLWHALKDEGSKSAREQLILLYTPLVGRVVGKMRKALPPHVDADDLRSYGVLGLIRAIDYFDLRYGTPFETFAVAHIRGMVLDELRSLDWAPRSLRRKQRDITRARIELQATLADFPTDEQIAGYLGVSEAAVREVHRQVRASHPKSLDERAPWENTTRELPETMALASHDVPTQRSPEDDIAVSTLHDDVAALIAKMSPMEQLVLALYYYEGLHLTQVAQVTGLPESRVSALHTRAMMLIRDLMVSALDPAQ